MSRFKQSPINPKYLLKLSILVLGLIILGTNTVMAATIGVGVGTGKIRLDQPIKPSLSYKLPSIAVFNNGDVTSDYEMSIEYNETQPEQKPPSHWFKFSPQRFNLEPGKSQRVDIEIKPEYSARPGDYFAYIEAHPTKKDETGTTAIRVAAATKLNFKVIPANFFQRVYYLLLDFWNQYKAPIILITGSLLIAVLVLLAKKYLRIELKSKKQE
jgi:hypothetical protein